MALPLDGIRVLDLTRHLPGPYATDLLRRLGAAVIKIEPPTGDPTRHTLPPGGEQGALFALLNAGKKSVAVDLKSVVGRELVQRLARECDVLVESYRPGVAAGFGVDYETLVSLNPRLIYCSISGYGAASPRSGHDLNFVALAGLLDLQRDRQGRPVMPSMQLGDMGGALFGALAILAALFERASSGRGRKIDISMADVTRVMMPTAESLDRGMPAWPETFMLAGAIPSYNLYRTADAKYLAVATLEPQFWKGFCEAIGHPELIPFPIDGNARERVAAAIATRSREEWESVFAKLDVCVEPVLNITESHERYGDPMLRHPFETNFPAPAAGVDELGASLEEVADMAGIDEERRKLLRQSTRAKV